MQSKFTAVTTVITATTFTALPAVPSVLAHWHHIKAVHSVTTATDAEPVKHVHHRYEPPKVSVTAAHVKPPDKVQQPSEKVGKSSRTDVNVSQAHINVTAGNVNSSHVNVTDPKTYNVPAVIPPGPSVWRDFPSAPSQGVKYVDQLTMEMDVNASKIDKLHPFGK